LSQQTNDPHIAEERGQPVPVSQESTDEESKYSAVVQRVPQEQATPQTDKVGLVEEFKTMPKFKNSKKEAGNPAEPKARSNGVNAGQGSGNDIKHENDKRSKGKTAYKGDYEPEG
jgi:hypothetical protein